MGRIATALSNNTFPTVTITVGFSQFHENCSKFFQKRFAAELSCNEIQCEVRDFLQESLATIIDEAKRGGRIWSELVQQVKYPVPLDKSKLSFELCTIKSSELQDPAKKAEIFSQEAFSRKDMAFLKRLNSELIVDGGDDIYAVEWLEFNISLRESVKYMFGNKYPCSLRFIIDPLNIDRAREGAEIYYSIEIKFVGDAPKWSDEQYQAFWEGLHKSITQDGASVKMTLSDESNSSKNARDIGKPQIASQSRFPHKLPRGIEWKDITILFLNGHDVEIQVKGIPETYTTNYINMGFEDKRQGTHPPNEQWKLLVELAKNKRRISWADKDKGYAKLKNRKQKSELTKKLKSYFQLFEDPFYPYGQAKAYQIRLNLNPDDVL